MKDDNNKSPLKYLEAKELKKFEEEIHFEYKFFAAVAETEDFEIIPIPCEDGSYLTEQEKQSIVAFAAANKRRILFRVSLGRIALTFSDSNKLIGVSPEYNTDGFPC